MPSLFQSSSPLRKSLHPAGIFALFLLYFVFGTGWYEPAQLVLHGQALSGNPLIKVRWDSGQGFNNYEQRKIQLLAHKDDNNITLGATGQKDVACTAILVDGKAIDLALIAGGKFLKEGALYFKGGETISFTTKVVSNLSFKFSTYSETSGTAFISVNGLKSDHNLFLAGEPTLSTQFDYWFLHSDGSFMTELDLPRYPIHVLEIMNGKKNTSINLISAKVYGKGKIIDLLHNNQSVQLESVRFNDVLRGMKTYFHPLQFCQQIFFALLSTWILMALLQRYTINNSLRSCLLVNQRQWFWLMLVGSLTVFGAWLSAFWPGVMSIDSFKIWRAATLPNVYSNEHPLLNIILYKYLYHLWSNTAVVPVIQILLTALLISWFGFWIFQQRVPSKIVLLWVFFVLCSVPVGVYNVVLWKDIPFALLVVFWVCILVQLRQEKQQNRLHWATQRICALLLLGLALGLIRHNGMIYLAVLPALFLLLGLVPLKKALPALTVLLLIAGIAFMTLRNANETKETGFLTKAIRWYANTIKLENMSKDVQRTAHDYLNVLDIEAPQADKFHYYLYDRHTWLFLLHSGWWDMYPYQHEQARFPILNKLAMQIYERSYKVPWVWLTWNPIWLLALLPILTLCFRWLPNTAILGAMLLAGALPLVYLQIFNWRYYYFLYFGLLFLPAFISLDIACRKKCASPL